MSRHGNPCQGGGGWGIPSGRRTPLQTNKPVNRKKEYYYYIGSSNQASNYETTLVYIISYTKKTFDRGNDVAKTLQKLVKTDPNTREPTLKASKETDQENKKRENEQLKMENEAELDEALKGKRMYTTISTWHMPSYGKDVLRQCRKIFSPSQTMKMKYINPIKLLKAIKEHALKHQETWYEKSIISDAFRALWNTHKRKTRGLKIIFGVLRHPKTFWNPT